MENVHFVTNGIEIDCPCLKIIQLKYFWINTLSQTRMVNSYEQGLLVLLDQWHFNLCPFNFEVELVTIEYI